MRDLNPSGAGILMVNYVNAMATDALAPCVASASAAMVLTMQDKRLCVLYQELFQLPAPAQWRDMIENKNIS